MREPIAKYALREILRNGTVHPQIVLTITAQDVADLSHKIPRTRPSLVIAEAGASGAMTVIGLNQALSASVAFKAEKDITLAYLMFARRAMKHNHTIKVWVWNGAPDGKENALELDDFMTPATHILPDRVLTFTPRDFRKNNRVPVTEAARRFYECILAGTDIDDKTPSGPTILKIFSTARR